MPIYEFYCPKCDMNFEVITIKAEWKLIRCHKCQGKVKKVISKSNFAVHGANAKNSYGLKQGDQDE